MAALAPLAAGDPPMCNYTAYYNDERTDTFEGDYTGVMADYVLDGGGVRSAQELAETVNSCASQRIPTAFLVLIIQFRLSSLKIISLGVNKK